MDDTRIPKKLKNFNTCDDNVGLASWSNLNHDLLFSVMMRVGVFDFIALSGVCKSWRSVAVSNWNKFMVSKQPLCLSISTRLLKKDCYFEDQNKRRKLKITIPHSNGRRCVGLTCGYLIFYGMKTRDFWLVNPFTRKELHFPDFPFRVSSFPYHIRGILVFSPSMSGWVFVVSNSYPSGISFCLAGKKGIWRRVASYHHINDLHFFKGKIYMIDTFKQLWELRLNNPEAPTLTLLKMENFPRRDISDATFVSSGEHLYVRNLYGDAFKASEVDFDEMKWVNSERTIGEYAVFISELKCDAAIKPDTWTQYERLNCLKNKISGRCLTRHMWYFPHRCFNENDPDMKNGGVLNILKE